jgi:hypothetical protein
MIEKAPLSALNKTEQAQIDELLSMKGKICLVDNPIYKNVRIGRSETSERIALATGSPVYIARTKRENGSVTVIAEDAAGDKWPLYVSNMQEFNEVLNPIEIEDIGKYLPQRKNAKYKLRRFFCKMSAWIDSVLPSLIMGPAFIAFSFLLFSIAKRIEVYNLSYAISIASTFLPPICLVWGIIQFVIGYTALAMFCNCDYAWYANDDILGPELRCVMHRYSTAKK